MDDGLGGGIVGGGAELLIGLDEEKPGTSALKVDDGAFADLAAVEAVATELAGADAPWSGGGVEEIVGAGVVGIGGERDFEVELARFRVPVKRQQTGDVAHGGGALGDGLRGLIGWGRGSESVGGCGEGECDRQGKLRQERSSHETL